MRIVHTSDWHAGRIWRGISRLPELADVLERLGDFIEREKTDLLLVSGDVFDSGAPIADAERIVFSFFKRVGRAGTETVVIAGNHDHPARLQAWGTLAELVRVHAVALPRKAKDGGVVPVETRSGERALVGAVPFAAPRLFVTALELAADETRAKQTYADCIRRIVEDLASSFTAETVNLLMAHTHLEGALFSGSERQVHLGEDWAASPQAFPSTAHYVALGHIHRPQKVDRSPSPAFYAGSPLQLDFGEVGERKIFLSIDARPREPARIDAVPYEGGKSLVDLRATIPEIERDATRMSSLGWLRVRVPLAVPDPDLNGRVRRLLANAVSVEAELPRPAEQTESAPRISLGASPGDLFRAYYAKAHGREPDPTRLEAFEALRAEAEGD